MCVYSTCQTQDTVEHVLIVSFKGVEHQILILARRLVVHQGAFFQLLINIFMSFCSMHLMRNRFSGVLEMAAQDDTIFYVLTLPTTVGVFKLQCNFHCLVFTSRSTSDIRRFGLLLKGHACSQASGSSEEPRLWVCSHV